MSARRILLAGATGRLGRHVLDRLTVRGEWVRALSRDPSRVPGGSSIEAVAGDLTQPASLHGLCEGVDTVISCAGASMTLGAWKDRTAFEQVDYAGNAALLFEARRARARRFVYVSIANPLALRSSVYVRAHERFVYDLESSGLESVIVRPTGFYCFLAQLIALARRGVLVIPGDGAARTNPIHEDDVAAACVDAVTSSEGQIAVGGPEVLTRRRIAELAFECTGRPPRVVSVPPAAFGAASAAVSWMNPRLYALVEFGLAASRVDVVAPAFGRQRLGDYLRAFARSGLNG